MKRILFAAALAALFAGSASAEDKPAAPATPAVTAAPVEMAPAPSARRGLLARLRDRRTTSAPVMAAPAVTAPATPMPAPGTAVPKPMPTGGTTGSVTPAGGSAKAGEVVTASYSEPAARRGLFSRLRNR